MTRAEEILSMAEGTKKPRWSKNQKARAGQGPAKSRADMTPEEEREFFRKAGGAAKTAQGSKKAGYLLGRVSGKDPKHAQSPDVTGGAKPHLRGVGHDIRKSDVEGDDELRTAQKAFDKKHPFWDKKKRR